MKVARDVEVVDREAWVARARELYGKSRDWKFRCVACGHVQSVASVLNRNPDIDHEMALKWIYFACEGRHTKGIGCNWSLGGLFQVHRRAVKIENGELVPVFLFADDPPDNAEMFRQVKRKPAGME